MEFTATDITSLTAKLVALDLTAGEREALRTIVAAGVESPTDGDEVSGFEYEAITMERGVTAFRPLLLGIGRPAGRAPDGFLPTGETAL